MWAVSLGFINNVHKSKQIFFVGACVRCVGTFLEFIGACLRFTGDCPRFVGACLRLMAGLSMFSMKVQDDIMPILVASGRKIDHLNVLGCSSTKNCTI